MRTSNDYVNLDSVVGVINSHIDSSVTEQERSTLVGAKIVIKKLPRINEMVEKGRWETYTADGSMGHRGKTYKCGNCDYIFPVVTPFCPNCGADMREEE